MLDNVKLATACISCRCDLYIYCDSVIAGHYLARVWTGLVVRWSFCLVNSVTLRHWTSVIIWCGFTRLTQWTRTATAL